MNQNNQLENKIKEIYNFLSSVNKVAYKDFYLLSNQVLSKNPFTNNFLKRYLNNEVVKKPHLFFILKKLSKYYFLSLKDFKSYILEFIEFYFSAYLFKVQNKKELILIDTRFIIRKIKEDDKFVDYYFPGLTDLFKKKNKNYAYLPVFDGIKKRFTMYKIFRLIKKEKVPLICEYQLLSILDLFYILYFVIIYPFKVIRLTFMLESDTNNHNKYKNALLKSELIDTLNDVTFRNFARYLQGKRIAKFPYQHIKIISWYENQVIDKNLYKGLRINTDKIKIYGAQLFLYSNQHLNLISDENELECGIVPDKILVNGPFYIPKVTRLDYSVGPSFRYSRIFNTSIKKEKKFFILVLLPYFKNYTYEILNMLNKIKLPYNSIFIKTHPALPIDEFKHLLPKDAQITNENIYKLFMNTKFLIGAASGTLLEATSLGIPSIVIKNNDWVEFNPLPNFGKGEIWDEAFSADDLEQKIINFENILENNSCKIDYISSIYKRDFFCIPSEENIIKSFEL